MYITYIFCIWFYWTWNPSFLDTLFLGKEKQCMAVLCENHHADRSINEGNCPSIG